MIKLSLNLFVLQPGKAKARDEQYIKQSECCDTIMRQMINSAFKVNNIVEAPLSGQSLNNHYFANEETFLQKWISGKNAKWQHWITVLSY